MTGVTSEKPPARFRQESLVALAACVLASCGILWTLWSVPLVLTNDGPQSLLLAHIDAHYDDPGSIFPAQFSRGLGLSGRGFMFLYAPLEGVAWPNGVRVAEAIMLLGFAWGAAVLARVVGGRFSYKSVLGFVLCLSWPFYMGFWAFYVASAVGLWLLAAVVAARQPTRLVKLAISVGLLCQLFCHPVMATVTFCAIGLVVLSRHVPLRRDGRAALQADFLWLLLSGVPNVVVFGIMQGAQATMSKVVASEKTEWETLPRFLRSLPRLVVPGSTALGWLLLALAVSALVFGLVRLRREPSPEKRGLTIAAFGLLSLALLGPLNMPGWQYFAPRFLPFALALCVTLPPELETLRARVSSTLAAGACAALAILNAGALNAALVSACGDALFALDEPRQRTGMVLPIIFDSRCGTPVDPGLAPVPYMAPALHMSAMFPIRHGGGVPFVFAGPAAVHVLVPKQTDLPVPPLELWGFTTEHPEMQDPAIRAFILDRLLLFGVAYEAVQIFGKNDADMQQMIDRGMVVELDHGSYASGRMEPCSVDVVIDVQPGDPPMLVTAGLRSLELWVGEWGPSAPGTARASFRTVCGKLWTKVKWEDGTQRCKNADEEQRILLDVPVAQRALQVRCER